MCYVHRCEGFAELVLEVEGIEFAHRYVKIFRSYHMVVAARSPILLDYGLRQESQFRMHDEQSPPLSTTNSIEAVYKALPVGDEGQQLPSTAAFQLKYRNGLRAREA